MSLPLVVRAVHEEAGDEREDNGVTPGPCLTSGDDMNECKQVATLSSSSSSSSSLVAQGGQMPAPAGEAPASLPHNRLTVV